MLDRLPRHGGAPTFALAARKAVVMLLGLIGLLYATPAESFGSSPLSYEITIRPEASNGYSAKLQASPALFSRLTLDQGGARAVYQLETGDIDRITPTRLHVDYGEFGEFNVDFKSRHVTSHGTPGCTR